MTNSLKLEKKLHCFYKIKIYSIIVLNSPNYQGILTQNFNPPLEFYPEFNYMCSHLSFSASSLFPNISPGNYKYYYSVREPVPGRLGRVFKV